MLVATIGLLAITANVIHGHSLQPKFDSENHKVGGNIISIKDAPYQVSVRYLDYSFCGGSIISNHVVFVGNVPFVLPEHASRYSIQYGVSDFGGNRNVIGVKSILLKRNPGSEAVALMILNFNIHFSAVAQPIPLASIAPEVGAYANVTGWGFFPSYAGTLHQASVQIMDRSICQEKYQKLATVNENDLCAGIIGGKDYEWQFDFGSPVERNGVLIGSVSLGIDTDSGDYYGIYTNIAVYKNWIDSNTN